MATNTPPCPPVLPRSPRRDGRRALVANPHRFDPTVLPDGSQVEVSGVQRYYNEVVRVGQDAVSTEWDNDPPDESGPQESGITAHRIQHQVSGFPRKQVPPGCVKLTQGIDVHKQLLYYVVKAWREDCTGYVIDYDVQETHGTTVGTDEGLDNAIRKGSKRVTTGSSKIRTPARTAGSSRST